MREGERREKKRTEGGNEYRLSARLSERTGEGKGGGSRRRKITNDDGRRGVAEMREGGRGGRKRGA